MPRKKIKSIEELTKGYKDFIKKDKVISKRKFQEAIVKVIKPQQRGLKGF